MNKVAGKIGVKGSGVGIPGLLVIVYDLDPETEPEESPDAFSPLSQTALFPDIGADCLGSTCTDEDGFFELTYEDSAFRVRTPDEERPDLWLMVLAPESPGRDPDRRLVYASTTVRQNAGQKEYFLIDIPESQLREADMPVPEKRAGGAKNDQASPDKPAGESPTSGEQQPEISDHTLLRRIAKGSYGEVWLARNVFGHLRAVKIVYASTFSEDQSYRRELFGLLHFEPVSRSHPGFVQVYHVGRNDAARYFFYVMELADPHEDRGSHVTRFLLRQATLLKQLQSALEKRGRRIQDVDSLQISFFQPNAASSEGASDPSQSPDAYAAYTLFTYLCNRPPLSIDECLALALWLSHALNHLHNHDLVHRDIKPSNIVFVQGIPKFADIGLVTTTSNQSSFVGTEGYVPPEGPGTIQTDLYALGKVLYEALTGKDRTEFPEFPPFRHDPSPKDRKRLIRLNEVILKAAEPDLSRRYQTAAELYYDLISIVK